MEGQQENQARGGQREDSFSQAKVESLLKQQEGRFRTDQGRTISLTGSWNLAANLARLALGIGLSHQHFLCLPSPSLLQVSQEGIYSSRGPGMEEVVGLQYPTLWEAASGHFSTATLSLACARAMPPKLDPPLHRKEFLLVSHRKVGEMGKRRKEKLLAEGGGQRMPVLGAS